MQSFQIFGSNFEERINRGTRITPNGYRQQRLQTIRTAISDTAKADDLAHPGHIFPLKACANGVFDRSGHTEGSIHIVRFAGLGDSAILCELTNIDGSMAKLPVIIDFVEYFNIIVMTRTFTCTVKSILFRQRSFYYKFFAGFCPHYYNQDVSFVFVNVILLWTFVRINHFPFVGFDIIGSAITSGYYSQPPPSDFYQQWNNVSSFNIGFLF